MTQFCVYRVPGDQLVLDLQSDLTPLPTNIVAPLVPLDSGLRPLRVLEPVFEIGARAYWLNTGNLVAVHARLLTGPPVADLSARDYEIRRALDMLFSGF